MGKISTGIKRIVTFYTILLTAVFVMSPQASARDTYEHQGEINKERIPVYNDFGREMDDFHLVKGEMVTIVDTSLHILPFMDWSDRVYQTYDGYFVRAEDVDLVQSCPLKISGDYITNKDNVSVKSKPFTEYEIARLSKGEIVTIDQTFYNSRGSLWGQGEIDGSTVYIYMDWLDEYLAPVTPVKSDTFRVGQEVVLIGKYYGSSYNRNSVGLVQQAYWVSRVSSDVRSINIYAISPIGTDAVTGWTSADNLMLNAYMTPVFSEPELTYNEAVKKDRDFRVNLIEVGAVLWERFINTVEQIPGFVMDAAETDGIEVLRQRKEDFALLMSYIIESNKDLTAEEWFSYNMQAIAKMDDVYGMWSDYETQKLAEAADAGPEEFFIELFSLELEIFSTGIEVYNAGAGINELYQTYKKLKAIDDTIGTHRVLDFVSDITSEDYYRLRKVVDDYKDTIALIEDGQDVLIDGVRYKKYGDKLEEVIDEAADLIDDARDVDRVSGALDVVDDAMDIDRVNDTVDTAEDARDVIEFKDDYFDEEAFIMLEDIELDEVKRDISVKVSYSSGEVYNSEVKVYGPKSAKHGYDHFDVMALIDNGIRIDRSGLSKHMVDTLNMLDHMDYNLLGHTPGNNDFRSAQQLVHDFLKQRDLDTIMEYEVLNLNESIRSRKRVYDIYNEELGLSIEIKTGILRYTESLKNQARKDHLALLEGMYRLEKGAQPIPGVEVNCVQWHVFKNTDGVIGYDPRMVELLESYGIEVHFHY